MSNNQFDILQAIRRKDYLYVWERTKYLGYQDVSDIEERYLLFRKAISIFNPDQSNESNEEEAVYWSKVSYNKYFFMKNHKEYVPVLHGNVIEIYMR